jgi:hypothetical protein
MFLPEAVDAALEHNPEVVQIVEIEVEQPATVPSIEDILSAMERLPPSRPTGTNKGAQQLQAHRGIDFIEREARNQSLGRAGEEFVINYERARLSFAGKDALADSVEWVSRTKGDGEGYDVLSFEESGHHRFIEVKTTRYGRYTPFFVSPNELRFCDRHHEAYRLYRVFAFKTEPRMFSLKGAVKEHCRLDPTEYRASVL